MALGTNYSRNGRKTDLVVKIGLIYMDRGMSLDEARDDAKQLKRKTVDELQTIYTNLVKEERLKNAIDINKKYTCGGKPVIGLEIVMQNSAGNTVTYPVKGSIVVREKPLKLEYAAWSIDGQFDVVWGKGDNLIEIKETEND